MIKLEKVNKYFNYRKKNEIHVINDTSLELPDTGLVALLGPSGCGKTTLLNTIGGLDKVKSGNIYINNQKITQQSIYQKDKIRNENIGYIFQNFYLIDDKTVFENVALSLTLIGIKDKKEIKTRVNYILEALNIYRYRNRQASMLSGGERQRVAIARALVKDPNIIIADEPTGNLDSANTIAIMNIIKTISKTRLVLLVTHETDLAKFYADRIIEIEDGMVKNDYANIHDNNLDYRIDNKIYLKDFKYQTNLKDGNNSINIYNEQKSGLKLSIIVKDNNIYIKSLTDNTKIEIIDDNSNVELVNEHYHQIDKSIYEQVDFNLNYHDHSKYKYSSIFNLLTLITNGFKKIFSSSKIQKILLLGFLGSGAFITYAVSNIMGLNNIKDEYFIEKNRHYYDLKRNINFNSYEQIQNLASVDYLLPGNADINFQINYNDFWQTQDFTSEIKGSVVDKAYLQEQDLLYGRMPINDNDIVVDKMVFDNLFESSFNEPFIAGYKKTEDFLTVQVTHFQNTYIIVGIVDQKDPSIYVNKKHLISLINDSNLKDYQIMDIKLTQGKMPLEKNEVIVNSNVQDEYILGQQYAFDGSLEALTVVGYYQGNSDFPLTNQQTIAEKLLKSSNSITIMPKDNQKLVIDMKNLNYNIKSSYETSLNEYKAQNRKEMLAGLSVCAAMLFISFVEIYLMIRSSFLSRIKEVGIYRAIGVKRFDIYKMFSGEILAITTLACLPGVFITSFILHELSSISYFAAHYLVNPLTIIITIILIYGFNLLVGLLPVMNVMRQTPADILARKDID